MGKNALNMFLYNFDMFDEQSPVTISEWPTNHTKVREVYFDTRDDEELLWLSG